MAGKLTNAANALATGNLTKLGAEHVKAVRGTVIILAMLIIFAGLAFAGIGAWLAFSGFNQANSVISFGPLSISTSSVGMGAIAMGVTLIAITMKNAMKVLTAAIDK